MAASTATQVATSHHARDALRAVVDHAGQVIRDAAVAPAHVGIAAQDAGILREVEPALVAESDPARGEGHAQWLVAGAPASGGQRASPTRSRVAELAVLPWRGVLAQHLAAARAGVEPPLLRQAIERRGMPRVRVVLLANGVPFQTKPREVGLQRSRPGGP